MTQPTNIAKLFEPKVFNGIQGYWYRFWWRFLLGAEFIDDTLNQPKRK